MNSESGSMQHNSALDMLKQRQRMSAGPPTLMEQQPNILYTMPPQTVERLEDVLRLLARLEGGTEEDVIDATVLRQHGDRKTLAREQRKKIALGHKADDHEQGQQMG